MSEHVSRLATRISTLDGAGPDVYDHEISLIDTTESATHDEARSSSPSPSWRQLAKRPTRSSLRDHLAKKKYAKWSETRPAKADGVGTPGENESDTVPKAEPDAQRGPATATVDFAPDQMGERGRVAAKKRRQESKYLKHQVHEIDILYENQRGSFFCGIPLYAHSSLLPTDPSPWVNKDLHDSPVNITNAQVPDPSWEWAWKTWYVDMSYDVDEEGWQYSFAFGRHFAWHGSHPWFHSFVRRRRWLRKRVKTDTGSGRGALGSLGAAHHLNKDYFTIHSTRGRSPVSAVDGGGKTARPASIMSFPSMDVEVPPEDIKDIASLLKALKFANVDREKIDVVKRFVDHGGEELVYLKDHISNIMSFLVFQNSRRQLLSFLKESANEARRHREQHEDEAKPEGEAESRKIDNLLAAVDAADAQIGELEFWSDRKHVLQAADDDSLEIKAIATIFDEAPPKPKVEDDPVKEIKGISDKADLTGENMSSVFRRTTADTPSSEPEQEEKKEDKGKGKAVAHDSEDDQVEGDSGPRLGSDQVLVPDTD